MKQGALLILELGILFHVTVRDMRYVVLLYPLLVFSYCFTFLLCSSDFVLLCLSSSLSFALHVCVLLFCSIAASVSCLPTCILTFACTWTLMSACSSGLVKEIH